MKRAVVFLLISLVLIVLIASGLSRLKFNPGMPIPSFENGHVELPSAGAVPVGLPLGGFARILSLIVLAAFLAFLVFQAVKGVPWKKAIRGLWGLSWKILLAALLLVVVVALLPKSEGTLSAESLPPPKPLATAPLGPVPPVLIWCVALGLSGIALFLGLRLIGASRRPAARSWEQEVEDARQALLDGHDLRQVIIRCYLRMGQALQQEQKIEREASMTTGEFEALLAARGVPADPVHQLTRLFDAVRYGRREPLSGEEQRALQCLDAVLAYSRQAPPAA
jgi:Domain of unknown function (DUF4129)